MLNSANPAINTRAELAKMADVSGDTIAKTESILAKGSDLLKAAARSGKFSVNQAAEFAELPPNIQDRIAKSDKQEIRRQASTIKGAKRDEQRAARRVEFKAAKPETDKIKTWARLLEGESDSVRLEKLSDGNDGLNVVAQPFDVWNYTTSHELFGRAGYPGQIPGQLVLQALYFYTEQGDLVVDPMAGGGTTIDACLVMGRRCLAFDSEPTTCAARKDIIQKDALAAIRELTEAPDLIFCDPPYYNKIDRFYGDNSISKLGREEYLQFFSDLAKAAHEKLSTDGRFALLMSDYADEDDPGNAIFIDEYITRFKANGFRVERIISCNLSTDVICGDTVNKFRASKRLARQARNLMIFHRSN